MFKKTISVLLVLVIVGALALIVDPLSESREVSAADTRNGFVLVPEKQDDSGIAADTSFILTADQSKRMNIDELRSAFYIEGENEPVIEQMSETAFRITPGQLLKEGKVYIAGINEKDGTKTTWAFQTSQGLKAVSFFPADKSTNVPVNTGIEIYFNQSGLTGYEDGFEIIPETEGSFEVHKNVLVFVPVKLKPNTIYTVNVKSGISVTGSEAKLREDCSFSFATAPEINDNQYQEKGYVSFSKDLAEYSSVENVLLPIYYYFRNDIQEKTFQLKTTVYSFDDIDTFKKAYEGAEPVPYWARGQIIPDMTDTSNLKEVLSITFELPVIQKTSGDRSLDLGMMPNGYYLVHAEYDGNVIRTFVQVTDIAVFVMNSDSGFFIWVKDFKTAKDISGAVLEFDSGEKYYSDSKGAIITRLMNSSGSDVAKISAGNEAVLVSLYDYDYSGYRYYGYGSFFWNIFQTDRNLYKPDDTISFFGFLKPRYDDGEAPGMLTVEISRGGYYPYYDYRMYDRIYYSVMREPLQRETVSVEDGFFDGSIDLPNLAEGSYNISVKNGDSLISSIYFRVEEYTKPAYKIEMEKNKRYIFLGEPVEFHIKTSFYEGTPVSNLDFRLEASGYMGMERLFIEDRTDINGAYTAVYIPTKADPGAQGMAYINVTASSSIPEMGEVYINDGFHVFINDIWADYDSGIKNGRAYLDIDIYHVDITKLEQQDEGYGYGFKGAPVSGKTVEGNVYRNEYVRKVTGEYYDYINKVTRETYTYENVKTLVTALNIKTDAEGKASFEFFPEQANEHVYYTAEFSFTDSSGRTINNTAYFHQYADTDQYWYYDDYSRLELIDAVNYGIGDSVNMKYLHMGKEIGSGSYAYVVLQNGIRGVEFTDSSRHSFLFTESMMPNISVGGVFFTGKNFEYVEAYVPYDYFSRRIELTAQLDRDSYRPGEEALITVSAVNTDGAPVSAHVNISVVDEALFALGEQYVDTLESLFSGVWSGVKYTFSTHTLNQYYYGYYGMGGDDGEQQRTSDKGISGPADSSDVNGSETYVRSEFKDTAYYRSIKLDENGTGFIKIRLPDNITSWRITMQAVSDDIRAGSDKVSLSVTMPVFINYSLSDVFLVGDKPYAGVSVYGSSLSEGDIVRIRAEGEKISEEYEIKAFERVYISIPLLDKAGEYELKLSAFTAEGESDAVVHRYSVMDSYYESDEAVVLKAKKGMELPSGTKGLTTYIFKDSSTGKYARYLYPLAYVRGNRIEQKAVSAVAMDLINTYFDNNYTVTGFDSGQYQKPDGGIAFLPYGESDIFTTVTMIPYIRDKADMSELKIYLYSVLDTADQPNAISAALYGLSLLNEPVLIKLKEYEKIVNQDTVDRIYTALAYTCFGEVAEARRIYSQHIAGMVIKTETNARLEFGEGLDERLKNTALLAVLAVRADLPESEPLFNYIVKEHSNEYLTIVEKLEYIKTKLSKSMPADAKVKYSFLGETTALDVGSHPQSVTVPSQTAEGFMITDVVGDVDVIAVYKVPGIPASSSGSIMINREYSNYSRPGEPLSSNDIVRVTINAFIEKEALEQGYVITDYLPSGLRMISNYAISRNMYYDEKGGGGFYYGTTEGQKVYFYVYGDRKKDTLHTISYLARVVNPGEFTAEKPMMRAYADKGIVTLGRQQSVIISK